MYRVKVYRYEGSSFILEHVLSPQAFLWGIKFRTAVNAVSTFTGTLAIDAFDDLGLSLNKLIVIEEYVSGSWQIENAYLIKKITYIDDKNSQKVRITGPDINWFLKTSLVKPLVVDVNGLVSKTGPADDIAKEMVRENLGTLADADRQLGSLFVQSDASLLPNSVLESRSSENLFDVLHFLSSRSNMDFWMEFDGTRFIFKAGIRGTDRTISSGMPYFIFSTERGNIINVKYEIDHMNVLSKAYVHGQGSGQEQTIHEYPATYHLYGTDRWDYIEGATSVHQSGPDDILNLENEAITFLYDSRPRTRLDFEYIETPSSIFKVHFELGDYVTARYRDYEVDVRIRASDTWLDEGGKEVNLEVSDE